MSLVFSYSQCLLYPADLCQSLITGDLMAGDGPLIMAVL